MRAARRSLVVVLAARCPSLPFRPTPAMTRQACSTRLARRSIRWSGAQVRVGAGGAGAAAGPVKKLTAVVDTALGGQTSLSNSPLVSTVDTALTGKSTTPAAPVETPEEVAGPGDTGSEEGGSTTVVATVVGDDEVLAGGTLATVLPLDRFAVSSASRTKGVPGAPEGSSLPTTSTLPDGGSPLTLAWLVLAFAVTAAGALVIRRARTVSLTSPRSERPMRFRPCPRMSRLGSTGAAMPRTAQCGESSDAAVSGWMPWLRAGVRRFHCRGADPAQWPGQRPGAARAR